MRMSLTGFVLVLSLGQAALAAQRGPAGPAAALPAIRAVPIARVGASRAVPLRAPVPVRPVTHAASPGVRPAIPHRPTGQPVLPHPVPSPRLGGTTFLPNPVIPAPSVFVPDYPVPGLGFDYPHFFATHPGWGTNQNVSGIVLPFVGGGGFYLPIAYYPEAEPSESQPSAAPSEPSPSNDQSAADTSEPAAPALPQPQPRENTYTAPKPVEEFVFVKRDGTKIFAVAYSLLKDKVQYITREGLRRTLTLDALDFDATERSNEERGNTINLPKPFLSDAV